MFNPQFLSQVHACLHVRLENIFKKGVTLNRFGAIAEQKTNQQ